MVLAGQHHYAQPYDCVGGLPDGLEGAAGARFEGAHFEQLVLDRILPVDRDADEAAPVPVADPGLGHAEVALGGGAQVTVRGIDAAGIAKGIAFLAAVDGDLLALDLVARLALVTGGAELAAAVEDGDAALREGGERQGEEQKRE